MHYKANKSIFYRKNKMKWMACLLTMLLLVSMFPAAVLAADSATMAITTTVSSESEINSNDLVIDITLTNNKWAENIATSGMIDDIFVATLKEGFTTTTDTKVWNDFINGVYSSSPSFERVSDTEIKITVPKPSDPSNKPYDILSDQVVTFTPPASMLKDSSNIPAAQSFTITADPQATLSGSLTTGATESDIVSGGKQLTITLVNCQWQDNIATDATLRSTLFSELQASGSESTKWNTDVYNALITADPSKVITRTDEHTVTITLPAVSGYDISGNQTVTLSSIDKSLFDPTLTADLSNIIIPGSFTISPDTNSSVSMAINGDSELSSIPESSIRTGGTTLILTLSGGNTWADDIGTSTERQTALLNGFSVSTDGAAWNVVKNKILSTTANFTFDSSFAPEILTIIIPSCSSSEYNILADQTVTVKVPSTVLTNNNAPSNTLTFTITANPAVAVSGTLTSGATEADIVNGGKTIVAKLTNATWDSNVMTQTNREDLIDDLLNPTSIWPTTPTDAIATIKAGATYTLTDASTVTITLPSVPDFNIPDTPDTGLTLSPQLSALQSLTSSSTKTGPFDYDSTTSFTISPVTNQSASISGTVTSATESDIATGGKTLALTLKNDVWVEDVVSDSTNLSALQTALETALGKNFDNALSSSNVVRTSDTVLTITLPSVSSYTLSEDTSVSVTIPSSLLTTGSKNLDAGSFTVKAMTVALSGTAIPSLNSTAMASGGKTIVVTLKNVTWASDVITSDTKRNNLLGCFSGGSTNWTNIKNNITAKNMTLSGKSVLTIKLPATPYTEGPAEELSFSISSSLFSTLINENLSKSALTASETLTISSTTVTNITAVLTSLSLSSSDIVNGGKQIIITLTNGTWDPSLPTNKSKINSLVSGFTASADSTSWALVQTALKNANLTTNNPFVLSNSNATLTITLPSVSDYAPTQLQTITLTIPKTTLVSASSNVDASGQISISLPSTSSRGTLESLLGDGLAQLINNPTPLSNIYFIVPTKHITSVAVKQTTIGTTVINSFDIYTDSTVTSVNVKVNEAPYSSSTGVTYGSGKKFNVAFATTASTDSGSTKASAFDAAITASGSGTSSETIEKISGSKTYKYTDLGGTYRLDQLISNSSLLNKILSNYSTDEILVATA